MSGKGGGGKGFFEDLFGNPFGGIFDFNGDGTEDLGEQWIGYQIFKDFAGEEGRHRGLFDSDDASDDSWRLTCEDGSAFGIDPEDYETEADYEEALNEAKYAWRDDCADPAETGIDPEDYETEADYEEALNEAKYAWRDDCADPAETGIDPEDYETEEDYEEALTEAKFAWRDDCADLAETGIDPEDYETEADYEEALDEAKYAWRDDCADVSETGIDPEDYETEEDYEEALEAEKELRRPDGEDPDADDADCDEECETPVGNAGGADRSNKGAIKPSDFPNQRRYNAARLLADPWIFYSDAESEKKDKRSCRFILEKADSVLAANYLSYDSGFLYAQAVKDHFTLPVSLPDEDETREYEFDEMLLKLAKRDVPLSFAVWEWCLEQFLPYREYDAFAVRDMTTDVLDDLSDFPEGYSVRLVRYMDEHPDFRAKILPEEAGRSAGLTELIVTAIRVGLQETATFLFDAGLAQAKGKWKEINAFVGSVIFDCKDGEEVESMEFFRDELFGKIKAIRNGMVQDEIGEWEKEIAEYIESTEQESERYAYSRRNAWRRTAPDGKPYDLDPVHFSSEREYLDALEEAKHGWRKWYADRDTAGLDPAAYETEDEFCKAYAERMDLRRQKIEQERKEKRAALASDRTVYTYCGVIFPFSDRPYSFISDVEGIRIGDTVLAPVGDDETETEGVVVSVGRYLRIGAPFPVEKTKHIRTVIPKES